MTPRAMKRTAAAGVLVALLIAAWSAPLPARIHRPISPLVLDREGGWMRVKVTGDDGGMIRIPVRRSEIPDHLVQAVLAFEDQRFYWHPGVDPIALVRATLSNLSARRVVSGGSTLTMQVARMLERRPRTLRSKLIEVARAFQLELHYSKSEILELYFNLAPYGGNVEGAGTAAFVYFGRSIDRLTLDEVAILAALPNSPTTLDPRKGTVALAKRRNDVLARLATEGAVEASESEAAQKLPIIAQRRPLPFLAPHLSEAVLAAHPGAQRLATTIDRRVQERVESILADHLGRLATVGITQGAVVVIENATHKVRAYAGSKRFFDVANQGQVDGARALRSPGSTLKPFVYALALDRGLIGENSLIEDVPLRFKDWMPENFDGQWHGVVSAKEALQLSLNIPAVRLAQRLEPHGLIELLGQAEFSAVNADPSRFGLAAVLGGVDVSLLELTNAYVTFADGGEYRPVRLLESDPAGTPRRLFSPGAAYLITEILSDVRRPEFPDTWRDTTSIPMIAFKTGTSYGHRDAWSVGVTKRYTIGVWTGNFDSRGVPELVGVQAAAPLLLRLSQALAGDGPEPWFDRPDDVREREVCALSGMPAGAGCPYRTRELALTTAPTARCSLHQTFDVDDQSGHRLCSRCRAGHSHHPETHVVWPATVAGYLKGLGVAVDPVPEHEPTCEKGLSGEPPVIRSPNEGDEFVLRPGVPKAFQEIALIASSVSGAGKLYWFVDDELVGSVSSGTPVMLSPRPGAHRLVAVDGEGRRTAVSIRVTDASGG